MGLESVCRVGRCAINDNDNKSASKRVAVEAITINVLLSERDRISFTSLCFLSPVHTLPHVSSFEEHKEQRFHELYIYSFVYTRNFVLEGSYIYLRLIRWQLEVSRKCLSLLVVYEPSRVRFRLRIWFIYCKCSSLANPVARTKVSWPPPRS